MRRTVNHVYLRPLTKGANTMTIIELAIAENKALLAGNAAEADRLRTLRWQQAMSLIVNGENTKRRAPEGTP
jgi:hypothetical protein